jgi:hypothetical protein
MSLRKSNLFLSFLFICLVLLGLAFVHALWKRKAFLPSIHEKMEMVKALELTDLCLFTEASYTRHLTQADLHTPFQNHPMALEHFPSGSLVSPPEIARRIDGTLD